MKKKVVAIMMTAAMAASMMMVGCGSSDSSNSGSDSGSSAETTATPAADSNSGSDSTGSGAEGPIVVVSREDGSGTRGAFVELFGIEQKDESGEKVDMTIPTAEITNSTSVMMTTVAGNSAAIGYISLGSLDETVKAVKIDGAEASVETVKDGSYKVSRPFNIVTKTEGVSEAAQNFIDYIMSAEGQAVINEEGYIGDDAAEAFAGAAGSGTVTVAGSSSVTPVMEKLAEAYEAINGDVDVQVQQSDSTTGITNAIDGVCDIGMASRAVNDDELSQGVEATVIATDGIAVIVSPDSPVDELTSEQVMQIYTGEVTDWSEI
ncbi:MAG TPA: substrate-binding domain-containing protein [Candidatus Scatomonas pullistercoris]|uniref:Substrate-binding domain-containing protein n=1 Tax=Candidatus Scatomonas pullistercoris TaxID=2840920 RepID=A0A9D1P282_9FIRM|nr:substrate-binding domain-containing protein [Candidatus Scatomonas pullistercoris]